MNYVSRLLSVAVILGALHLAAAPGARGADEPKVNVPVPSAAPAKPDMPPAKAEVAPAAAASQKPAAIKIGYVEMTKVAESAPGKAALAEVKQKGEQYRSKIAARQKQLEKQKAAIEAKMESIPPQQRPAKAKEFQKKVEEFKKYVEGAEKEMRNKEAELSEKLFRSVEQAAGEFGKANGFAAIVIKKELLYVGDKVEAQDVTAEVMKLVGGTPAKK